MCTSTHVQDQWNKRATMTTAATMNTNNNLRLVVYHLFLVLHTSSILIMLPIFTPSKQLWRCQAPQTPSAIRPSRNYTWVICLWLWGWRVGSGQATHKSKKIPEKSFSLTGSTTVNHIFSKPSSAQVEFKGPQFEVTMEAKQIHKENGRDIEENMLGIWNIYDRILCFGLELMISEGKLFLFLGKRSCSSTKLDREDPFGVTCSRLGPVIPYEFLKEN